MKTKSILLIAALLCTAVEIRAADSTTQPTPLVTQSSGKLIQILQSDASRKEKADACRELAVVGDSKAVPVLVGLLANEELSHMARYALETIPGEGVNPALRGELARLHGLQLIGVVGSLGVRKDSSAVKPLSPLLGDSDPKIAQAVALALGEIGTADAAESIEKALPKTAPANRLAFCDGLFHCAEALAIRGKTRNAIAIYDHLRGLTDVPGQVRAGALRGAIVVRGKKSLGLLKESLATGDSVLFAAAVRATIEIPGPEVTKILTDRLPQLWPESKIMVMQALGNRGDIKALPALYSQANQGTKVLRLAAIHAIAAIGHSLSVRTLVELAQDSEREMSQAALDGLAGIPGREADSASLKFLKNPAADQRLIGIDLVGRRRMLVAMPELLTAATDANANVRSSAIQRVGKLGSPAEVSALLRILLRSTTRQELDVLTEALTSICSRAGSSSSAIAQIVNALAPATPAQKGALLAVLGALGGERPLVAVRAALTDSNQDVQAAALSSLSAWPDMAAAPDLLQIVRAKANNADRELAFQGYVRLVRESELSGGEKLKRLSEVAALADGAPEKMLVLAGFGDVISLESLQLVTPHLADSSVVEEAGAVAVKIAEKLDAKYAGEIGSALNQVLKSAKSPQVLDSARKRLEKLKLPVQ